MGRMLRSGEAVDWNTSRGETHGHVVKRTTRAGKIKSHTVATPKDSPEYIVASGKSGKRAAHKHSALKKSY
jgi:hypothetical protein